MLSLLMRSNNDIPTLKQGQQKIDQKLEKAFKFQVFDASTKYIQSLLLTSQNYELSTFISEPILQHINNLQSHTTTVSTTLIEECKFGTNCLHTSSFMVKYDKLLCHRLQIIKIFSKDIDYFPHQLTKTCSLKGYM